jgi:hypothetical protein
MSDVIARHARSYGWEEMIFDPLHYLSLLEQKSNALDQAAPGSSRSECGCRAKQEADFVTPVCTELSSVGGRSGKALERGYVL